MASKKDNNENNEKRVSILPHSISQEMKDSFLDYAMSVITDRALPDVRDGLKPVHRRILYAMYKLGLTPQSRFKKSATVVGEVLGKYHPHGDAAVYETMVKMIQTFTMRYPLGLGQGNFGSIDGDNAAAMRYTESKMSKVGEEMLSDIEKETVDFVANYDGSLKEPSVLPAGAPNLLLNGTLGIAVGMATNIPPHNLRELNDAVAYLIDNPDATNEDLMKFIKGPDFPTGGMIFGKEDILHAYTSGRGSILTRGHAEVVEEKAGRFQIIITSIPFRVNKSDLIVKIADLVKDKKIEDIKDIRDESTANIRVVIDLKPGSHPQKTLNKLYKLTQLEDKFHLNMVALVGGVPQTLSIKRVLKEFIDHRYTVIKRRTQFDLKKALAREHILLGLKKALDHIDEIIQLIKKSKDKETAHEGLMKTFKFSAIQADAILQMQLQRLAGLERKKIEDELKSVQKLIAELEAILKSDKKMYSIVKKELDDIAQKYGDDRRTHVYARKAKDISVEDMIPDVEQALVYSEGGYVKRTDPSEYRLQKRGGVGIVDLNTKEEDAVSNFITGSTHSDILFFTDFGKIYQIKMYDLPEGKRATRGKAIVNFLSLTDKEKVTSILTMPKGVKGDSINLVMVTKQGTIKKVDAKAFYDVRRNGIVALKLAQGDEMVAASFVRANETIMLITKDGKAIRFNEDDVRAMGRTAGGVRGIKLAKNDEVVSLLVIPEDASTSHVLVIMKNGYGKKTSVSEYTIQGRGGSGIKTAQITSKTGEIVAGQLIQRDEEEIEVIAMSQKSQTIRIDEKEVPKLGRSTQGVRIMKLRAGDSVVSLVRL